jgi:hypothetical protein
LFVEGQGRSPQTARRSIVNSSNGDAVIWSSPP